MNTYTEENYLKAIYKFSRHSSESVSTNIIAEELDTKASSVTDMIKKLSEKKLVSYQKYKGVKLTDTGHKIAVGVIRKHRLWEYFLVEKLDFKWDEVHDMAEQLEHIQSDELVKRLDAFLEHPKYDPHGDPIPDKDGNLDHHKDVTLSDLSPKECGIVVGVKEHSTSYLKYLEQTGLVLGTKVAVNDIVDFDHSMNIQIGKKKLNISYQACKHLIIKKSLC